VHVAPPGGGVVDLLVARAEVGNFGCVYRDQYPPAAQHSGGDLPEGLVETLGIAHSYFSQLEGHRVGMHMKWPRGGRHEVIGDSSTRQDLGERRPIDLVAAYGAREHPATADTLKYCARRAVFRSPAGARFACVELWRPLILLSAGGRPHKPFAFFEEEFQKY